MYEDMAYKLNNTTKRNKFISKKVLVIVLVAIILFGCFLIFGVFKDKNVKMEEKLVREARNYVSKNSIYTNKEIYLDVSKLNIDVGDNCSLTSGVIFDGKNYYPNLVCKDYKSNVIKANIGTREYITLKGDEVMILSRGMIFSDPGYISGDIVSTIGNVGSEEGVYNIYYKTANSNNTAIRKVIIIDNQLIRQLFPTITLNGDDVVYLVSGHMYQEEGVTAFDQYDGNISSNVKIEGNIYPNVLGEYTLSYIVTNSRGYSNVATRKINVISSESELVVDYKVDPATLTNQNVLIKLSISDEYQKIIYPNGDEGTDLVYEASENGTYKFIVYDKYDRPIEKEIEIDNIDREVPQGSCLATRYYNKTEVKVNISTSREISSYEYYINDNLVQNNQSNFYMSSIVKPSMVKVKVKDSINNQNEFVCSFEDKLTRKIVTNDKGKNCLEGFTCYIQMDYSDSGRYPYCSILNNPNACGGIGKNGCSITSATNAIAAMGVKSKKGTLHTPYTVWEELYPINHKTGLCDGGCSAWTRIRDSIVNAGLTAPSKVTHLDKTTVSILTEHLKKGYPAVVWANTGGFTSGKHYMSILGIREDGYVFLSDSGNRSGTMKYYYKGKQYYVDTWISTDDLITGEVGNFLLVGPPGMYEGK